MPNSPRLGVRGKTFTTLTSRAVSCRRQRPEGNINAEVERTEQHVEEHLTADAISSNINTAILLRQGAEQLASDGASGLPSADGELWRLAAESGILEGR